jgi:hypothetical protein
LLSGHADLRLVEQLSRRRKVARERHLYISLAAEQDQRYAVALPACDEVADDAFHAVQTLQRLAARHAEIVLIHRSRDIDGKNEIARGNFARDRIADPLRTRQCGDHQHPGQRRGDHLDGTPAQDDRTLVRRLPRRFGDAFEERHLHRCSAFAIGRQQPPCQER